MIEGQDTTQRKIFTKSRNFDFTAGNIHLVLRRDGQDNVVQRPLPVSQFPNASADRVEHPHLPLNRMH